MNNQSSFSAAGEQLDKPIGDIFRQANNLSAEQVESVLTYQREHGVKFGEAAVALGIVKREDVLWALSQQYNYAYAPTGTLSISPELVVAHKPFGDQAEFFRDIRSQLITSVFDTPGRRALAVVSADVGDGKSYFCANLAVAFSQLGGRTLLVDADMRTPRQNDIFGIESVAGLSGILAGRYETNVIRPVGELPSLYVLPVGVVPPNPMELVQRPTFSILIKELISKFDYVIVDTPAGIHGADARVIAATCGASVALSRKGSSRLQSLNKLIGAVSKSAKFAGVVMNDY